VAAEKLRLQLHFIPHRKDYLSIYTQFYTMSTRRIAVVLGLGEVGYPIFQTLWVHYGEGNVQGYDLGTVGKHSRLTLESPAGAYTFMHVCFPQSPKFLAWMKDYVERFDPEYVIIHSTLSPGMTAYLAEKLSAWRDDDDVEHQAKFFYSPVRGNIRDDMNWCLKHYTKYVAPHFSHRDVYWANSLDKGRAALAHQREEVERHLRMAGFKVKMLLGPAKELEWAKLLDLAWYGVNIAFYQELERIVADENMNYKPIREFIESTPIESEGRVPRVVFYGGHIGGHCVIQGIEKILPWYDIPMLKAVLESNIKRESEVSFNPASVLGKPSA
jgi:hypothetical protein